MAGSLLQLNVILEQILIVISLKHLAEQLSQLIIRTDFAKFVFLLVMGGTILKRLLGRMFHDCSIFCLSLITRAFLWKPQCILLQTMQRINSISNTKTFIHSVTETEDQEKSFTITFVVR